jgi:parvulin-like peptidyl-prolyl isomerase
MHARIPSHREWIAAGLIFVLSMVSVRASAAEVLASVNGMDITTEHVDNVIMRGHNTQAMNRMAMADVRTILGKAIQDELIWQDAVALELDQDQALLAEFDDLRTQRALSLYVRDNFDTPTEVNEAAEREFFERFYFKVGIRQISVPELALAASFKLQIDANPPVMDSLARDFSVDSQSVRGGLHDEKYWADVEEEIREQVTKLEVGELSSPFAYRDAYVLVRLESRSAVDEDAFESHAQKIRDHLLEESKRAAWLIFSEQLLAETPVTLAPGISERLHADSEAVFRAEFRVGSPEIALRASDDVFLREDALRTAVSHAAMGDGTIPFAVIFKRVIRDESEKLALLLRAKEAGYLERPELAEFYSGRLRESVIGYYLEEMIVPQIKFRRDEFESFYEANLDKFRSPTQVKLDMLVLSENTVASEMERRLEEGADFQYLKKQFGDRHNSSSSDTKWASIELFSDEIRAEIDRVGKGGTSKALEIPSGWLIFRLHDIRPGPAKSLDEADPVIRQVMYRNKFKALVDEHLALLTERSEVVYYDDAIDKYASSSE